jgi:hypothetical protein
MPNDGEILQPAASAEFLNSQQAKDLELGKNMGVIEPSEDELQSVASSEPVEGTLPIINPSKNWDKFLGDMDWQKFPWGDTLACNIWSSVHCCEAMINCLGQDPELSDHGTTDLSERHATVEAGLNGSAGSSQTQWQNMINNCGLLKETIWPYDRNITKAQFFQAIPADIKAKAKKFLDKYDISHRRIQDSPYQLNPWTVSAAAIKEALQYGPVKIFLGTGKGWNNAEPKEIPKTDNPMNHAVMVRYVDDQGRIHIYDQYPSYLKVLAADYRIDYAFQTILVPKNKPLDRGLALMPDGRTVAAYVKISTPIKPISEIQNMPETGLCLAKDGRTVLFYSKEGTQTNIDHLKAAFDIPANAPLEKSSDI